MDALPICRLYAFVFTYSTAAFAPAACPSECQVDFNHADITECQILFIFLSSCL